MMTAIDRARLDEIVKYPELIKRTTPWDTVGVCLRCMQEVHIAHASLRENIVHYTNVSSFQYRCPNCRVSGKNTGMSAFERKISPIPHALYRKRMIVIKEIKRLFRSPIQEGIIEWEKLSDE